MKVLISFLGTYSNNRQYKKATYMFPNGYTAEETTFIAKALKEYYNIDKLILIGTTKSMWEEVYDSFRKGNEDNNLYLKIGDLCENQNAKSDPELFDSEYIKAIENAMGNDSRVIMIKYGINEEEIQYNIKKIFSIEEMLNTGDEIYLDITHSFRSLPIYLMNCMAYISNVSKRNIKIKSISYGMFEASSEFDHKTPVVEMKSLMDVYEWISGAYSFSEFGNTYKISKLIEDSGNKDIAEKLFVFAETNNLNMISDMKKQIDSLNKTKWDKEGMPEFAKLIVKPAVKNFTKRFNVTDPKDSLFQIKLAKWHFDCHNYGSSVITLCEGVLTSLCEAAGFENKTEKEAKKIVKDCLYNNNLKQKAEGRTKDDELKIFYLNKITSSFSNDYIRNFRRLLAIRNMIAHNIDNSKESNKIPKNSVEIKKVLADLLNFYLNYYNTKK